MLDESGSNDAMAEAWSQSNFEIGHSLGGFFWDRLTGAEARDKAGRKMLFVLLSDRISWTARLYGKERREGEGKVVLSELEKSSLGFDLGIPCERKREKEAHDK